MASPSPRKRLPQPGRSPPGNKVLHRIEDPRILRMIALTREIFRSL